MGTKYNNTVVSLTLKQPKFFICYLFFIVFNKIYTNKG